MGAGRSDAEVYHREVWKDWVMETYEWLALVLLPAGPADRLYAQDAVDPLLSVYAVDDAQVGDLTRVRISGVLPARWVEDLWAAVVRLVEELPEDRRREAWVALAVQGFNGVPVGPTGKQRGGLEDCGSSYVVMRLPAEAGIMEWESVGGQSE